MSSYTSSSLTLRAVLKSAAGRLGMGVPAPSESASGDRRPRVSGLTAAAKAMFAALQQETKRVPGSLRALVNRRVASWNGCEF